MLKIEAPNQNVFGIYHHLDVLIFSKMSKYMAFVSSYNPRFEAPSHCILSFLMLFVKDFKTFIQEVGSCNTKD